MSEQPQTATIIDGRYRVLDRVGSGGMADVFSAEDLQLGRVVAVKLLHRRFAEDEEFVERFRREASAAAGLQHPNVVSVYDRGEWDGTYYIAMELLEGRSLKRIIVDEAPLDPDRATDLAIQILRAARFAHRRGIIHRDLKPHNVIVADGPPVRAKVTDFGIARAGASDMTQTGSIMGTAQYLSPEQAQGHPVDARSDLYAIGVILYEMLTGRVPFEGDSAVTIALKHVSEDPEPPHRFNAAVSPALEAVVFRALAKEPDDRFDDADQFVEALEDARDGQTTAMIPPVRALAPPPTRAPTGPIVPIPPPRPYAVGSTLPPEGLPTPERRRWWPWVLALVVALLAIAGIAAVLLLGSGGKTVPDVVGAPRAEAEIRLKRDGFSTDVTLKESRTIPKGEVFGQDPSGGDKLGEGKVVNLTVSAGPGTARIPVLAGQRRSAAQDRLEGLGFNVTTVTEASSSVTTGRVLETRPAAGEELERGQEVQLVVSSGRSRVRMPNVVGQSEDEARATLENAGLKVTTTPKETTAEDAGTVLASDPASDATVREGDTVTLTVAAAPAQVAVPSVVGQTPEEATTALEDAGFTVARTDASTQDPNQDGVVVSQVPAGGQADRGSKVTIGVGVFDAALNPEPDTGTTTPGDTTTSTTPVEPSP